MCLLCGKTVCELTDDTSSLTDAGVDLDKSATTVAAGPDIAANTATTASMTVGGTLDSDIGFASDQDWIRINLTAGQWYEFTVVGIGGNPLSDSTLALMDASGNQIAFNDDGFPNTFDSRLIHLADTTGTYYLNVGNFDAETGDYRLSADTLSPTPVPADAITWTANDFNWGPTPPSTINVYFETRNVSVTDPLEETNTTVGFTAARINQMMAAIETFEDIINVDFVQTTNLANADFVIIQSNIDALGYWSVGGGSATIANVNYTVDGLGVFDSNGQGWNANGLEQGGYGYLTFLHEFGHGLGLAHPHDGGGGSDQMAGVADQTDTGLFDINQTINTVMSYADGWVTAPHGASPSNNYGWNGGPMALDIAVLQDRYGANMSTNTGNTVYTLPTSNVAGTFYTSIWDAGGTDSIVHSGNLAATIDLRTASLVYDAFAGGPVSYATGIHGGFTIAAGVVIENATGGNAGDTIIGNAAANYIEAGNGNDTVTGGAGNDTLHGQGGGDDWLDYGAEGGANGVQVNLSASSATDTFGATDSVTGFENVMGTAQSDSLYGAQDYAVNLLGGAGDDQLWGYHNAGDALDGGAGANLLAALGGSTSITGGSDTDYVLTSYGNNTVDAGAGNDQIYVRYGNNAIDLGEGYNLVLSMDVFESDPSEYLADSNDTITGGSFDDYIYAGRGLDVLSGGAGNDWLAGGEWADTLTGGAGFDRFIFEDESGFDRITDFTNGDDYLDFTTSSLVSSFSDLSVVQSGADLFVGWNSGASGVTLENFSFNDFSAADILV